MGVRAHGPYTALVIPAFSWAPERALSRGSAPAHGFLQPFLHEQPASGALSFPWGSRELQWLWDQDGAL